MPNAPVEVDVSQLRAVNRRMIKEVTGKQLRKDLVRNIRAAVAPGVSRVQEKLRAIPHAGATPSSPSIGSFLASKTQSSVRLTGVSAGVRIRIPQTPQIRGFKMAARRFNATHWRHRVFGRDVWVEQQSPIPGYFDDTLYGGRDEYRAAVYAAIYEAQKRLSRL